MLWKNLQRLIDPASGGIHQLETARERMVGQYAPRLLQVLVAAGALGGMIVASPLVALFAGVCSVAACIRFADQRGADEIIQTYAMDGVVMGDTVVRYYDLTNDDDVARLAGRQGVGAIAFAADYLAMASVAGFTRVPNFMVLEPRVRITQNGLPVHGVPTRASMNAFASGTSTGDVSYVAIGETVFDRLSPEQLRATVAHEMGHLLQGHPQSQSKGAGIAIGMFVLAFGVMASAPSLLTLVAAGAIAVTAKICDNMISRHQEATCDRAAALMTGDALALSGALDTLRGIGQGVKQRREDVAAWREKRMPLPVDEKKRNLIEHLMLSRHPSDERRAEYMATMHAQHDEGFWYERRRLLRQDFARVAAAPADARAHGTEVSAAPTGGNSLKTGC